MKKRLLLIIFASVFIATGVLAGCGGQGGGENQAPSGGFEIANLENYRIIYPEAEEGEYRILAKEISDYVNTQCGERLRYYADSKEVSGYEILLGKTNRELSKSTYQTTPELFTHKLVVEGNNLQIVAGGAYSAKHCFDSFKAELFHRNAKPLKEGTYYQENLFTAPAKASANTDVRIMSTNILSEKWGLGEQNLTTNYRAEIYATMLLGHKPDVVGVQECDEDWQALLPKYLGILKEVYELNYQFVLNSNDGMPNYSCLIYRADKFSLIQTCGIERFSWWTEHEGGLPTYDMRNVTYAQFSLNANPDKCFVVANTHWSYRTEHESIYGTDTLRQECKDETNSILNSIKSVVDYPIFITGDFNTSIGYFQGNSSWMKASEFELLSKIASSAGTLVKQIPSSGFFDHIFGFGDFEVLNYNYFNTGNQVGYVSDHNFILADVKLS